MELTAYQKADLWGQIEVLAVELRDAVARQCLAEVKDRYARLGELIARMEAATVDTDDLELWAEFDEPQEKCPKCGSGNITNEDGPDEFGRLPVTCHDCGYQWHEPDADE